MTDLQFTGWGRWLSMALIAAYPAIARAGASGPGGGDDDIPITVVSEPLTLGVFAAAATGLYVLRRRRMK